MNKPFVSFKFLFMLAFLCSASQAQFIHCETEIIAQAAAKKTWAGPENERQATAIQNALNHYRKTGEIVSHLHATDITGFSAGLLFSTGEYLKDGETKGIFESREHFFVLFDQAVLEDIARIESSCSPATLQRYLRDETSPYFRLKSFHFLRVPISHRMRPEVAKKFFAYLDLRAKQVFGHAVVLAVDELEKSGVLFSAQNAQRIVGITYDQLMGTDYYGISERAQAHDKRVSPRIVEFWRAFYEEVNRRIEVGSTNENLLSFNLLDVIFEVGQGDAYFRKVKALFNEARPRAQQLFVERAIDIFLEQGVLFTSVTAGKEFPNVAWMRIMGRNEYAPGKKGRPAGSQSHRRFFDDPVEFWILFSNEIHRLRTDEPNHPQFDRLDSFSLYTVRLDHIPRRFESSYRAACERDQEKDKRRYVRKAVHLLNTRGLLVDRHNCLSELGIDFNRLCGKRPYTADRAFGHLAVFPSEALFWESFRMEKERRAQSQ